ncbi:protein FRIGIDA-ESSENTIAL 1 [Prosopis cineraria]|uniref:protein FRIGIDA-ESSENTIAL 1 n=1 Tax=Prosopis cineraria TaxID=364024 RepID=UPI00240FFF6E|nr:protein FRIGIDA-ESSENTIAL 1 [Prosopis cineraria]
MSLSESPVAADEDSDPSIDMEVEEDPGEEEYEEEEDPEEEEYEEVEVEEEVEEEEEEEKGEEDEEEEEGEEEGEEEEEEEEGQEEVEQEEEEVEVEEEVEEEEVEMEEVEVEVKDNFKVSELPADAAKDPEDLSQHMESEGQERNLRLVSSVAAKLDTVSAENNDSCKALSMQKEDFQLEHVTPSSPNSRNNVVTAEDDRHQGIDVDNKSNGSPLQCKTFGAYNELSCDGKAYLCGVKESGTVKSSSDAVKDVAVDIHQRGCSLEDAYVGTQNSINQVKQLDMHSGDEMKQMTSRFTSADMRTQSLSPSAEMKDGNKRPAILCSFFAKGWCIRGSSCRFLHIKDHASNTGQQAEGDLVSTNCKRGQLDGGLRGNAETSGMPNAPVPLAASLVSSSLHSSEFSVKETIQNEQEASLSQHPSQDKQKFPLLPKQDLHSKNHVLPIGRDSSTSRDCLIPENRSIFNASNDYCSRNLSSYPSCPEQLAPIQNQQVYNKYSSQVSAPSGYLMSSNLSTGASTLDAQKPLKSGKEYHAPRSTFLGSEWEELPLTSSSGVRPHAAGSKRKIPSYDWEPSVPFRPSFFITSASISSSGDMYDPFHPCVEITNIGDGSLKASFFIHGPPIQASSLVRAYGDCAVAGDKVADLDDDKSSVSSHHRFCEDEAMKNSFPSEKDGRAHETDTTARTYLNSHNGKASIGENTLAVEDNAKVEVEQTEHDAKYRGEGLGTKKRRVDKAKRSHEINVDFHMDGNMRNDLKALKSFRAALVDLAKELLKPSWQEGRLSKDAHNTIVKKSVDKVISTLQPHQIPTTIDAVNHFVSSSRLKIAKLVDGYVNKYSKC